MGAPDEVLEYPLKTQDIYLVDTGNNLNRHQTVVFFRRLSQSFTETSPIFTLAGKKWILNLLCCIMLFTRGRDDLSPSYMGVSENDPPALPN